MDPEILSTANFLVYLMELAPTDVCPCTLHRYRNYLIRDLLVMNRHPFSQLKFCITNLFDIDPIIIQAGKKCGFTYSFLKKVYLDWLKIFVRPDEVWYVLGHTNQSVIYRFDYFGLMPWNSTLYCNLLGMKKRRCKTIMSKIQCC